MRILVIDDEDDIRRIIRFSLERVGGMTVRDASGGKAGLAAVRQESPDAILLDVMMPGLDGPATLKALRRDPGSADIPVIFMTARVGPGETLQLAKLGAAGVITKPFDPMTLSQQVLDLLA